MSHRSLFWPITLIITVLVTLLLMFAGAPTNHYTPLSLAARECPTDVTNPAYPFCVQTQIAEIAVELDESRILNGCPTNGPANNPPYPPYEQCLLTGTAIRAKTETTGKSPTANSVSQAQKTPTATRTATPTNTATEIQPRDGVNQATPTRLLATSTVSVTPTSILPAGVEAMTCIPGATIAVEGRTKPRTALIVAFGGRPVGGGFSREDGSYKIWLRIGDERPGIYPVEVEDRSSGEIVETLFCQVPLATVTPTRTATARP